MSWIKCPKCGGDTELHKQQNPNDNPTRNLAVLGKQSGNQLLAAIGGVIALGTSLAYLTRRRCKKCAWRSW
jgi:LPXTG-motif cell wall-anchored protein